MGIFLAAKQNGLACPLRLPQNTTKYSKATMTNNKSSRFAEARRQQRRHSRLLNLLVLLLVAVVSSQLGLLLLLLLSSSDSSSSSSSSLHNNNHYFYYFVHGFSFVSTAPTTTRTRDRSISSKVFQLASSSSSLNRSSRGPHKNNANNNDNHNDHDDTNNDFDFDQMSTLNERLNALLQNTGVAVDSLMDYYEPTLLSFSVKPGQTKRISISSTCYALLALLSISKTTTSNPAPALSAVVPTKAILKALLRSDWRYNDLFQVSLLTYTLLQHAAATSDEDEKNKLIESLLQEDTEDDTVDDDANRFRQLVSSVLTGRPKRRLGSQQIFSDYILYKCCCAYALLRDMLLQHQQKQPTLSESQQKRRRKAQLEVELTIALSRCAEVSMNELCKQIAYHSAGDSTSFDIIRLAYSLLSYVKSTQSFSGSPTIVGREVMIQQQTGDNETNNKTSTTTTQTELEYVPTFNRQLAVVALNIFFQQQQASNKDGLWENGQPIYKSFKRQGRNVGNAFVFSVDTLASILELLPSQEYLRPHLRSLERTLSWIETHQLVEIIPRNNSQQQQEQQSQLGDNGENCDCVSTAGSGDETTGTTFQCYGKPLRGWTSPHLSLGSGPQAWSTAQVVSCLSRMKFTVRELMHNDVLQEFNGISISKKQNNRPKYESWNRLLDSDLGIGGGDDSNRKTIKSVLEGRVCIPFVGEQDNGDASSSTSSSSSSVQNPKSYAGAAYSTILFGPPGTAKTTICESLAERMGWDFVVIDTTAFLADGLSNVASRIRYVFQRLMSLKNCVILFDEIEEFCLDRETPGISMESRMLTTAMLTAINDLRRAKQSIFFVATNRLRAFDSAIIRPGRFDMQLFVGTPNLESRVIQFQQALQDMNIVDPTITNDAVDIYRKFLESNWSIDQDAMFMNFLEGKQFATSAANIVATNMMAATSFDAVGTAVLQEDDLQTILDQQASVMTVRGAVREEYIASMDLSRL